MLTASCYLEEQAETDKGQGEQDGEHAHQRPRALMIPYHAANVIYFPRPLSR
jgi:hypothetical protein